jgi:hypothetical protein
VVIRQRTGTVNDAIVDEELQHALCAPPSAPVGITRAVAMAAANGG